jgi:hypothetical protein
MTIPAIHMDEYVMHTYRVTFDDGEIKDVLGRWAPHAWSVARTMRPGRSITRLELLNLRSNRDH